MRISDCSSDVCSSDLIDRGEEFARRFSDIDTLGRIEAIIAIAAIIRWTFSEVTQQYGPAATARLHQSTKRGDAGALARLPRFIQFEDALARLREIFRAPAKMRFGRLAIAPSTPTFLVIGLNG